MPSEVATTHQPTKSLEGSVFRFQNDAERGEAIAKAFDYRGDVTLELQDGSTIDAFVFNYESQASPPHVSLYIKGNDVPKVVPYADITGVVFSGKDPAFGKSWEDWATKKQHERAVEAEKIKEEIARLGHL